LVTVIVIVIVNGNDIGCQYGDDRDALAGFSVRTKLIHVGMSNNRRVATVIA